MKKEKTRCPWALSSPLEMEYHDNEWGVIVYDDRKIFEMLLLEFMQAGLSWATILKKRSDFRIAFDDFDYDKIAKYDEKDFERLMNDAGIIRNKLKINAAMNNALKFQEVREECGSFYDYIWSFTDKKTIVNDWQSQDEMPASNELSETISKDLKKRGFKFVGPVIIYSFLQAIGIIDDHIVSCYFKRYD